MFKNNIQGGTDMEFEIIEGNRAEKIKTDCYYYLRDLYKKKLVVDSTEGEGEHHEGDLREGFDRGTS